MPTKKPQLNITLEPQMFWILSVLAKKAHKSISSLAKELVLEALERSEDIVFSDLAKARDTKKQKTIRNQLSE